VSSICTVYFLRQPVVPILALKFRGKNYWCGELLVVESQLLIVNYSLGVRFFLF
jgi:hypothetical protein